MPQACYRLEQGAWLSPVSLGCGLPGCTGQEGGCELAVFPYSARGTVSSVEPGSPGEVQGQVLEGKVDRTQNGVQSCGEGNLVEHQLCLHTTLRIHPHISGSQVFPSSAGWTGEGVRTLMAWEPEAAGELELWSEIGGYSVRGVPGSRMSQFGRTEGLDSPPAF